MNTEAVFVLVASSNKVAAYACVCIRIVCVCGTWAASQVQGDGNGGERTDGLNKPHPMQRKHTNQRKCLMPLSDIIPHTHT